MHSLAYAMRVQSIAMVVRGLRGMISGRNRMKRFGLAAPFVQNVPCHIGDAVTIADIKLRAISHQIRVGAVDDNSEDGRRRLGAPTMRTLTTGVGAKRLGRAQRI